MPSITLLATVTGRDRPGLTAAFFAAMSSFDVEVKDVEQVTIRERLILAVLLEVRGDTTSLRTTLQGSMSAMNLECEVTEVDTSVSGSQGGSRQHVIVLGHPLRTGAIAAVAQRLADLSANIESITQLSVDPDAIELIVTARDPLELRETLVRTAEDVGLDIAVEPAGLLRRAKRLVVLDVDSTLIKDEGIDVLADLAGVGPEVADLTARAMAGELDFEQALRARVELLAGMPVSDVYAAREALRLTPGARTFVRTLRRLGFHVGVVSGGFTVFTDRFVAELGLEFAAANELEIVDGKVTGRLLGPIVDRAGKAEALKRFAAKFDVPLSQTVAVGDGANDIDMLETAGLGIAFNAKAALRAAADASVNLPYLDSVLFVLGIPRKEIDEARD